jgi:hypothetical protein
VAELAPEAVRLRVLPELPVRAAQARRRLQTGPAEAQAVPTVAQACCMQSEILKEKTRFRG